MTENKDENENVSEVPHKVKEYSDIERQTLIKHLSLYLFHGETQAHKDLERENLIMTKART